jgi:hypothetical protein
MNEPLRRWSWIIAGILAVIATLYFIFLIVLFYDFGARIIGDDIIVDSLVLFSLLSAIAPFLALVGLAKRWRPLYLVSAIWFLMLTLHFGFLTYFMTTSPPFETSLFGPTFFVMTCMLCAAFSYLQGRLHLGVGASAAGGVSL